MTSPWSWAAATTWSRRCSTSWSTRGTRCCRQAAPSGCGSGPTGRPASGQGPGGGGGRRTGHPRPASPPRSGSPFFTTKGEGRGTGLGLSVVSRVIREHGGQISSTPRGPRHLGGRAGARFVITLPSAEDARPEPPTWWRGRPPPGPGRRRRDDIRELIRAELEPRPSGQHRHQRRGRLAAGGSQRAAPSRSW
ncbi:MAG: HAMP domain-containing histidine kinase [Planctomycetes bacterium]|nr:HAMP domain-containing histidine kinase [Planctomycetota bacterium]